MKTLIATLLATAAGAAFAAAPTAALNHDLSAYRTLAQKANTAYKAALEKCEAKSGNDKDVCTAEAKVARIRAEDEALSRYNNTARGREKSRTELANAEYDLAKARCGAKTGADKDDCLNNAKSVHTAAIADAKADRASATPSAGASATGATAAGADTCAGMGDTKTACVIESTKSSMRDNATGTAADKTKAAGSTAVEKTKEAAETVADKAKAVVSASTVSDTAITTKVKAGLVKEPNLESLGIHVETEKGVVMLSGFVNSKAEADKAVSVAKGVDGVTSVKSAIKVK
jgi:osmotically-inducible protein OsmY